MSCNHLFLGVAVFVSLLVGCQDGYRSTPQNLTATTVYALKKRILRFAAENNRLPTTLSELPPAEDLVSYTNDAWGNEIIYGIDGTTVTLTSFGKDGKLGGNGDDRDVVGIFNAKTLDGKWSDKKSDEGWEVEPLKDKD